MSFDIPETMTAIEITEFGGPEVLKTTARPVPQPAAGEILVRNAAVGVNFPDTMQRRGGYPPPPGTTDIPGLELAGTVVATGEGVARHTPGDEVYALVSGGAYAEYTVVPEQLALPLPKGYDMILSAAIPENFFTVWTNLFDGVQLTKGDSVLIRRLRRNWYCRYPGIARIRRYGVHHFTERQEVQGVRGTGRDTGDQLHRRGFRRDR